MPELPEGVVTFVFTDVEGSTRLWEDAPESMMAALNHHDDIIESVIGRHRGVSVKPRGEGDSRFLVFAHAADAVAAVAEIQSAFAQVEWETPRPIKVRASVHTGAAGVQLGDYYGSAVNRAARLRGIAHGGQTVISRSTWELVRDNLPDGVTIQDMGEHGLKDLTRPEHVFQVTPAGIAADFPPLKSLDAVANNLPQQLTEFVGRERELEQAARLLADTRLLTILAPGGTGKTRLGIQTAADVTADFPDGVFFVGLSDISQSSDIVQTIGESLGLAFATEDDPRAQLLSYLSNKRQLLVFDNFEHVADGAAIISDILTSAAGIKVIATSRSKLNVMGETTMPLAGLEITWDSPEEALQTGGVRLFLDAANRANPNFELRPDDLGALAQILETTGGSPLGILLAAAWVDMLPVSEIAAEVAQSLDFLETEMGGVPDRHRSVRAVFDYSWALLGEDERELFAALSVFRGGFTRDAARAVAGASLRNLATLSSKSLVATNPDTGRYAIHELLRAYAQGELEENPDRAATINEAHAEFYGEWMADVSDLFFTGNQLRMVSLIEPDIENLRSAWRHCIASRNGTAGSKMVFGLHFLYELRGWNRAAVDLFGEASEGIGKDGDDEVTVMRLMAQAVRGWFQALVGMPAVGAEATAEVVRTLPDVATRTHRWLALQAYAVCLGYTGWTEEMARMLDEGIEEYASDDEPLWSAGLKNWRSFGAVVGGDFETATRLLPGAYEVLERLDDYYFMTWNLWLQAMMALAGGDPAGSMELYERQVARADAIGYRRGKVVALEGLGDARAAAGLYADAEAAFAEGIKLAEQMGMVRDLLGMMTKTAAARAAAGRDAEAVELLATVCAEPVSSQQLFTAEIPIRDMAHSVLADIRGRLDAHEFVAAEKRGAARPYDAAAKELIDSVR